MFRTIFAVSVALVLVGFAALAPSVSASAPVSAGSVCGEMFSACDTYDPDVTCYSGGIWWQTACTWGSEWCDGI